MSVVRVRWPSARTRFGIVMAGLPLIAGCTTPKAKTALPQPPATQVSRAWKPDAVTVRVRDLAREADNLAADARQLPGKDGPDHVRIMRRVLTDLSEVLRLLSNPVEDPRLRLQLTEIENARAKLSNNSSELEVEPIINTALRTASGALADISHGENFSQADLGPMLDELSARLNRLDLERNPGLHRVDVADAVELTSQVVSKFAATLTARFAAEQPAGPTSQPSGPATNPSGTASDGK